MRRPAYFASALVLGLGVLALLAPGEFAALLAMLQLRPALYLAAAVRAGVGVTYLLAARSSRATIAFYFLGMVMIAGGLAVPIIGQGLARPILDAWYSGGILIVRGWGIAAIGLASFAFWALQPRPSEE